MGERDEAGLVRGGRQVDALLEHRPEEAAEALGVGLAGVGEAPDRTRVEEEAEHAAGGGRGQRDALAPRGLGEALRQTLRHGFERVIDARLAQPFDRDANDFLYQWDSSRDYNPSPQLEQIEAMVLAINSADDERNPPETGIMERELKRLKNARLYVIPASEETRGHGTTAMAKFYKEQIAEVMLKAPRRPM